MTNKIILITGVSSGFGRAFAEAALAAGYTVIGTVRNEDGRREFEAIEPKRAKSLILDVTDFGAINPSISKVQHEIGPVDVLVNNAGYGHEGILEESSLEDMRRQFEVNVFGAVALMKAVLPTMRRRRSGHIINITSMGGYITMPGIAYYCGSKFALEGITETLAKEVKGFGIHVTAVAPGSFRTDWAGRSMVRSSRSIADYDSVFDPIRKAREEKSGHQAGDPIKAAEVLLKLLTTENPPVHLLLGSDALKLVREKIDSLAGEITAWEDVTLSTDTEGDDCVLYMTTDGRYGEQAHVKRSKALSRLALLRFAGLSQINPKSQSECSGLNWRIRPGKAPDPVSVAALRRLTSLWVTPSLLADPSPSNRESNSRRQLSHRRGRTLNRCDRPRRLCGESSLSQANRTAAHPAGNRKSQLFRAPLVYDNCRKVGRPKHPSSLGSRS
jgi:NAD(P)-dependent dehydrogenase (short-subunit alcohol dehydrogenase family)